MRDLFPILLELPLFQGISYSDFLEIADHVRLSQRKEKKGVIIAEQGDSCNNLFFIMSGRVVSVRESDCHRFKLTEELPTPTIIQPEALFGLRTRYSRSYITLENVHLIEISKAVLRDVLILYPTFRINFFNTLSTQVQQREAKLWRKNPSDLQNRFRTFLLARVERPAGKKELHITMDTLAEELNTTRLNVSKMLSVLQESGLIEAHRGKIEIPSFSRFIQG